MVNFDLLKNFCTKTASRLGSGISNPDPLMIKIIANTEHLAALVVFIAIIRYALNIVKELARFILKLIFLLLVLRIGLDLYNNKINYSVEEFRSGFLCIFSLLRTIFPIQLK